MTDHNQFIMFFKHVELTQLDFSNSSDMTDVLVGYVYYLYQAICRAVRITRLFVTIRRR